MTKFLALTVKDLVVYESLYAMLFMSAGNLFQSLIQFIDRVFLALLLYK